MGEQRRPCDNQVLPEAEVGVRGQSEEMLSEQK